MLDWCDAADAGTLLDPKASGRHVIGIDIDIRAQNRTAIEQHPLARKIKMVEGSSIAEETIAQVNDLLGEPARVMVCLDSNHTHDHVLAELEAYAGYVTPGCYCVTFDTFVEDMPQGFIEDRPWDKGNNPKTAVAEWLVGRTDFAIDHRLETKLMITGAPSGFLKRLH
jgi:cephalosporin hydroxylase